MLIPFADKTVTVYNITEVLDEYNKPRVKLVGTVLTDCSWLKDDKVVRVDTIQLESDNFEVKIPQNASYVKSWEYTGEMGTFTLKVDDVIVLGEELKDYPLGTGTSELISEYAERSFIIRAVNDFTGKGYPLPHYQVVGR